MPDDKIFLDFFGLNKIGKTGKQFIYRCPFCGKNKLHINSENFKWDCKVCNKKGNKFTFIKYFYYDVCTKIPSKILGDINKLKSIPYKFLRNSELKLNPLTGEIINPAKNEKKSLIDLRRFRIQKGAKFYCTKGFNNGIFFKTKKALKNAERVFIAEGEWDYIILKNIFSGDTSTEVIGTAGAGTFKKEFGNLLKDKHVIFCFDNDKAGMEGCERVSLLLKEYTLSTSFIEWKEKFKGFDVRDLFIKCYKNGASTKKNILRMIEEYETKEEKEEEKQERLLNTLDGEFIPAEEIREAYKKWLYLEEDTNIDLVYATLIANRLPSDPIWLFLIAPPGGAKTELILSVSSAPLTYTTTQLTPHSLVSGMPSTGRMGDPSLIPKLNNKVLLIKDFTTIMEMPALNRDEVFGILRDAYDGKTEKNFGNGIVRKYESKFGIIAGVTPAIDKFSDTHSSLGERFLKFRSRIPDNYCNNTDIILKAVDNVYSGNNMRAELQSIGQQALSFDYINKMDIPYINDDFKDDIILLAQCVSILRASVPRERWTNDIIYKPVPEVATRIAKQFIKMLLGLCYFRNKKAGIAEYEIISRMAKDSVSSRTVSILREMAKSKDVPVSTKKISLKTSLPENTVKRVLQDLHILKCIKRFHKGFSDEWKLTIKFYGMLKRSKLLKQILKKDV